MGYNIDSLTEDCYPNTTVLINKLGIQNQKQLDEIEVAMVSIKSIELELSELPQVMNFQYYKEIHAYLFGELYEWAGTARKINMAKKQTNFCPFEEIEHVGESIFKRLKKEEYFKDCNQNEFVANIADFYDGLNYLHPFREGNGRCQRLFFTLLCRKCGYELRFGEMDSDELMIATIQASSGVLDNLIDLFRRNIVPLQEN